MKTWIKSILTMLALLVGSYTVQAQVKIGDNPTTINNGSVLELETTNMGLLMPRVSLTNTSTWGLLGTAAAGMHVYNTNTGITSTTATCPTLDAKIGEYYWDGSCWVALGRGNTETQDSPVQFSVKKVSASQNITGAGIALVNFNAADYDKNSSFNLATDKFTVPANGAGYYQMNGTLISGLTAGNQGGYLYVYVNGVVQRILAIGNTGGSAGLAMGGAVAVRLAAGDVVDFRASATSGSVVITNCQVDVYMISK